MPFPSLLRFSQRSCRWNHDTRSMKHADRPRAHTTGESQLKFATREMLLTGFCITYHGESRVQLPGGRRPFRRAGPGGSAGSCQSYTMHHGLSTRGRGGRTASRPASLPAAAPDPGKSRISSTEVKTRGRKGETREADVAGREGQNRLLGSSVVRRPNARRGGGGHVDRSVALPGSGHGRCVLVAGPRRVYLKPKVHSSRLF